MAANSAHGTTWDLSDLFSSYDDPRIDATLNELKEERSLVSELLPK